MNVYKLRLNKNGHWENVYDNGEFVELTPKYLAEMHANRKTVGYTINIPKPATSETYIEEAVEISKYKDAKEVLSKFVLQK